VFEVRATGGDSALGGDDLDRAIVIDLRGDVAGSLPPATDRAGRQALAAALAAARTGKEALTDHESTTIVLELDGRRLERTLTRADLARIAAPLLDGRPGPCRRTLKDAGFTAAELDGVVLVGGSTRSPVVRDSVRAVFGREPCASSIPTRSWPWARRCRPTSWPAARPTSCCSTSSRCRSASRPWAAWSRS